MKPLCDSGEVVSGLPLAFAIRYASGKQLDLIGSSMNVARTIPYVGTDGNLSDDDFRLYLLAKVLRSLWDGQNKSLVGMWQQIYPGISLKVKDNMDMTMDIIVKGNISVAMQSMISAGFILPIPMGVYATYTVISFYIPPLPVYLDTGLYAQGELGITNQEP